MLSATLDHRYYGTVNLAAMLLISAWHEQSHAAQIERLATSSTADVRVG
jgi:hypothetical protein